MSEISNFISEFALHETKNSTHLAKNLRGVNVNVFCIMLCNEHLGHTAVLASYVIDRMCLVVFVSPLSLKSYERVAFFMIYILLLLSWCTRSAFTLIKVLWLWFEHLK